MKCECEECNGTGRVQCEECNGTGSALGTIEQRIENIKGGSLYTDANDERELEELHRDAQRCKRQADELCKLRPERCDTYTEQFLGAL